MKRDRRKLTIEPLHLPPEDSRASKYHPESSEHVQGNSNLTTTISSTSSSTSTISNKGKLVNRERKQNNNSLDF